MLKNSFNLLYVCLSVHPLPATAAAITTVAIAVKQQSKVEKLGQNSGLLRHRNIGTMPILLICGALCSELYLFVYAYVPPNSKQCKCLDPKNQPNANCDKSKNKCGAAKYKGDGNCDDENK